MERLYEQTRVRYGNSGKKDREPNYTREGQTPPKKTVSFKEEKKASWFPGQSSWQMGEVDEPSDSFTMAAAAAAYAINSLEEGSLNRKIPANGLQTPLAKTKSKKEDSIKITEPDRLSRWFSDEISMMTSDAKYTKTLEDRIVSQAKLVKEVARVPSIDKPPIFTDKYLNDIGSKRFAEEQGKITGPNASPIVKTPTLRTGSGKLNLTNSGYTDTKADAWEKAELEKIQKRYDKIYSSLLEWENKKKTKAKQRLEHIERELQVERGKALQEYKEEIERIDKIAGGARTVTDEKKKKDKSKIKEKAKKIRSTGNLPRSCLFF